MDFQFPNKDVYLSRSPIVVGVTATGIGEEFLDATVEIYLWSGTEASKPADPAYTLDFPTGSIGGGEFRVDISQYIQSFLRVQGEVPTALWGSWFSVDIQAVTTVEGDTGSSLNCIAVDGYSLTQSGIVNEPAPQVLIESTPLEVKNGRTVTTWGIDKTLLGLGGASQSDYAYKIKHYNIDSFSGGLPVYDAPSGAEVTLDGATNTFNMFKSVTSTVTEEWSLGKDVWIEDGFAATIGDKQRVITQASDKFNVNKIGYVGSNGTIAYIHFNGNSRSQIEASRETFLRNPTVALTSPTFNAQIANKAVFSASSTSRVTLNTGFQDERIIEQLRELMISKNVFLEYETEVTKTEGTPCEVTVSAEIVPVIVETDSLEVQTHLTDKQINYSISFSLANNHINTRF